MCLIFGAKGRKKKSTYLACTIGGSSSGRRYSSDDLTEKNIYNDIFLSLSVYTTVQRNIGCVVRGFVVLLWLFPFGLYVAVRLLSVIRTGQNVFPQNTSIIDIYVRLIV